MDSFGYKYLVAIRCMTFQHADYITDALNGFCMQQTEFPYVCMVVDDASTDGEQNVIREYIAEHFVVTETRAIADGLGEYVIAKHKINANCDLVYVELSQNLYRERERKLSLIRFWQEMAKYEALCEGDDYWTDPHKLQKQVDFLETHPNVGLCYTDCDIYYEDENQWERAIYTTAGETFNARNIKEKRTVWYMANNTWVYSKSLYDQIAPNPGYIDGALYLLYNMCLLADVEYVEGVTSVYRRHKGSASCFSNVDERRAYQYQKSCFFLEARFTPKFPNSETNLKELYNYALFCLYERALKYNDKEVIEKIEEHFSPLLDMRMYQSLISQKQRYERTQYSKAYKLGRLLLQPIKWLKKINL